MKPIYVIAGAIVLILLVIVGVEFFDKGELGVEESMSIQERQPVGEEAAPEQSAIKTGEQATSGKYFFQYPADMQSGYYAVPLRNCPTDHCDECSGRQDMECGVEGLKDDYLIKPGFVEDFTYEADIPIVSVWELRDIPIEDIAGRCYVGDCNRYDTRNIICVYSASHITTESFSCDKWEMVPSQMASRNVICADGKTVNIHTSGKSNDGRPCAKPKKVNFYYVWNEVTGYNENWQQEWSTKFEEANDYFKQFNLGLEANYYEYELQSTTQSVCSMNYMVGPGHPIYNADAHLHVTLPDGDGCSSCVSNKRPKYCNTKRVHIHEFGHAFGATHVGYRESLGSYLYAGGVMAYGFQLDPDNRYYMGEYIYEAKIIAWALGQMD